MRNLFLLYVIPEDVERVQRLIQNLLKLGFQSDLFVIESSASSTILSQHDNALPENAIANGLDIFCWTENSVTDLGNKLSGRAEKYLNRKNCFNLILDEVDLPLLNRGTPSRTFELSGWELPNQEAKIKSTFSRMQRLSEDANQTGGLRAAVSNILSTLHDLAMRLNEGISAFKKIAFIAAFSAIFGIASNLWGKQDAICSIGFLHGPCKLLRLGHLPSEMQQADWAKARDGSDCEPIERYLKIYGPHAQWVAEAQQRLNLKREVPAKLRKQLEIGFSVPFGEVARSSRASAASDLAQRAKSGAVSLCSRNAQAFAGEYAPGAFRPDVGQPSCYARGDGFVCRASGTLQCSFLMPASETICPAS